MRRNDPNVHEVNSTSGRIEIDTAEASASIHSASGAVRIERLAVGQAYG